MMTAEKKRPASRNLKPPINKRPPDEQKALSIKGGKASGVARRKKRDMRKQLEILLSIDLTNSSTHKRLAKLGIPEGQINNQMAVAVAMFQKAANGDVRAAEFIRDMLGYGMKQPGNTEPSIKVEIIDDLPDDKG